MILIALVHGLLVLVHVKTNLKGLGLRQLLRLEMGQLAPQQWIVPLVLELVWLIKTVQDLGQPVLLLVKLHLRGLGQELKLFQKKQRQIEPAGLFFTFEQSP